MMNVEFRMRNGECRIRNEECGSLEGLRRSFLKWKRIF